AAGAPVSRRPASHSRGARGGTPANRKEVTLRGFEQSCAAHKSGATATLRPDSASVKSTWQDRREVASRKSGNSLSNSNSSLCGLGRRPAQLSSTYTWQVAQEQRPPHIAATP